MRSWLALALFAVGACGVEEEPEGNPSSPSCDTGARQTWETFGSGFLTSQCQGCHASTAPDRFGAPDEVFFDTEDDAVRWAARILDRATGDDADMPPAGGLPLDDQIRLERWLTCDLLDPG